MVSRKRSKGSKKGWQTRRFNAVKDVISRRAFDVWDQFTPDAQRKILEFRLLTLRIEEGGKDTDIREAITAKIEHYGKRIAFFFDIMEREFGLEKHEIKSILFSPIPRKRA